MDIHEWIDFVVFTEDYTSHPIYSDFCEWHECIKKFMIDSFKMILIEETKILSIERDAIGFLIKFSTNFDNYIFNHQMYISRRWLIRRLEEFTKHYIWKFQVETKDELESAISLVSILFVKEIVSEKMLNSIFIDNSICFDSNFNARRDKFLMTCAR